MRKPVLAALLAAAIPLAARAAAPVLPAGDPHPDVVLRDADFGVESTRFGLERRVEMFQWRRDAAGYSNVWNGAAIQSGSFDAGHRNPSRLPVTNRRWWPARVTIDGHDLSLDEVRLLGQWQPMHPNFSRLPGNYAARYQPEGDGLGSSLNPLNPEVGDVRITWHEFVLPPLAGKIQLLGGQWELSPKAASAPAATRPEAVDIAAATLEPVRRLGPWLIVIAAGLLAALWFLIRAITGGKH